MTLKAYLVDAGDWCALAYATTPGKAKRAVLVEFLWEEPECYLDLRATRAPRCDQFADGSIDIDDDEAHFLLAGGMVPCWHCGRELHFGDDYEVTPTILCADCAAEWRRTG